MNINSKIQTIYFIGIKGVGMSGLAVIAKEMAKEVLGSDTKEKFITDKLLQKHTISPLVGFSATNIQKALNGEKQDETLVVVTAAHGGMGNVEAQEAQKMGFEVVSYGKALGMFMTGKRGISVAGTHGKTTTTALIAHIVMKAGLDPSYLIGTSSVPSLESSAHYGKGEWFVAEADEYVADPVYDKTPKFLYQKPEIIVVTTIDWDHPDVFPSQKEVENAFIQFINNTQSNGIVIANSDDTGVVEILPKIQRNVITYGFGKEAMFRLSENTSHENKTTFTASHHDETYPFTISLHGNHNISNAAAAILTSFHAGISIGKIQKVLPSFIGSKRRFEEIDTINGVRLFDDYAHHPKEIQTTLSAFKSKFPGATIFVVFQPHTYSRTKALFSGFAEAFKQADIIGITDIFSSSREKPDPSISGEMLANEIKKKGKEVYFVKNAAEFVAKIGSKLQRNDILITMGAGDVYTWHEEVIKTLSQKNK